MLDREVKHVYNEVHKSTDAPLEIVPFLIDRFHPRSVIDVGCGIGTFLHVFMESNVQDIMGIDGEWVDPSSLLFPKEYFIEKDLERPFCLDRKYDLVLCLEVGEHLVPEAASILVDNLTSLGDIIIFSAAIKNQGGQNHINEQSFDYWAEKFGKKGFHFYDIFRSHFWNNKKVSWWYKQNMFLVAHHSVNLSHYNITTEPCGAIAEYVHPELLQLYVSDVHKFKAKVQWIKDGKAPLRYYLQLLGRKFRVKISGKQS